MEQRTNRTFICSVLFIDIVSYSTQPVEDQIRIKERFNALLSETIKDIAVNDRIILDTGDGAALGFLGDPEDALFVAMTLRDSLEAEPPDPSRPLSLRMGINLGPVKLVKDINNQLNLIGDGINVAQRIMSFAEPGKLLVSLSYYEMISCLSQEYARLFSYEGMHADKHIRKHRIYAVGHYESSKATGAEESLGTAATREPKAALVAGLPLAERGASAAQPSVFNGTLAASPSLAQRLSGGKWVYAAIALIALAVLIAFFTLRGCKDKPEKPAAAPAVTAVTKPQPAGARVAEAPVAAPKAEPGQAKAPAAAPAALAYKKIETIGFTVSSLERKGSEVVATLRLKNSAKEARSVALYDGSYSWTKSRLTGDDGHAHDVQEVYYRKGGKKITMGNTGKTGIPVDAGTTVTLYLVFKNFPESSREALLHLHPFIYHGWNWKEHSVDFRNLPIF
jgi:class 3 adenylate cyclase